jgi:hypothetical protein
MSRARRVAVLASLLCAAAVPLFGQIPVVETPLADSAMKLNRAGLWADAAEFAVKGVRETLSEDDRCGLIFSSIYALIREGQLDAGRDVIKTYDMQCLATAAAPKYADMLDMLRVEGALPPIPVTGIDLSGLDRFWTIVDTLSRDIEPSSHLWRTLLARPGYRLALRSNDGLQRQIDIAFRPSRRAERDSLLRTSGPDSAIVAHLVNAGAHRAELIEAQTALAKALPDSIAVAVRQAARYLPAQALARRSPPFVALALFANDGFSQSQAVVVDLLAVRDQGVTRFLSHEFELAYAAALASEATPSDPTDTELYYAIRDLRNEGIADLIDKPYPLREASPNLAAYASAYNAAYARTPAVLRSLDSVLVDAYGDPTQREAAGVRAHDLLVDGSHPNGAYMAREILDTFGRDSLVATLYNPFAFLRSFSAAEQKRGNPPPFSPNAVAMLDLMEKRWVRARPH